MTNIVQDLHSDHVNFSRVLPLLARETAKLGSEEDPDFLLMLDIMDYFDNYADLVHHAGEDIVFDYYRDRHHDLDAELDALIRQHKELKALTRSLYQALDDINSQGIVSKDRLREQLESYLQIQNEHMDVEERAVYPRLAETLIPADLARIESRLPIRRDPLFGHAVQDEYGNLYRRIREEALD